MTFQWQPVLTGHTICVQPLTVANYPEVEACARELATWADYPTPGMRDTGDITPWFTGGPQQARALAIVYRPEQKIIGTTRYYDVPDDEDGVGIGFTFLAASYRFAGATNADLKRIMLEHAFKSFSSVWFHVLPGNSRSQAAVLKLGAVEIGLRTLLLTDKPREFVCFRIGRSGSPKTGYI